MNIKPPATLHVSDGPLYLSATRFHSYLLNMKKVLIVESQPEVRELLSLTFETGPYNIILAENGEQALSLARSQRPEIILMDVVLPGSIDGLQLCHQFKTDPHTKDSYVLILTAKGQAADKEKGYAAGADGYIVKPFSPMKLLQKVRDILDGSNHHFTPSHGQPLI